MKRRRTPALVRRGKGEEEGQNRVTRRPPVRAPLPEVLCLAIMSVSQGLSSILFQVAWKGQLRILHPSPAEYSAAMGDVQLASGTLTCVLMVCAPYLFRKLGWAGTLGVTPKSAMLLGWGVFGASIWMANAGHLVISSPLLPYLVWGGSLLYVIERAAKFSLFKPAEEMVYITLDDESRTKGKAAVGRSCWGLRWESRVGRFAAGFAAVLRPRRRRAAHAHARAHRHRVHVAVGGEEAGRHARERARDGERSPRWPRLRMPRRRRRRRRRRRGREREGRGEVGRRGPGRAPRPRRRDVRAFAREMNQRPRLATFGRRQSQSQSVRVGRLL